MSAGPRILDSVTRRAPFGLRLHDVSGAGAPLDGLDIRLHRPKRPPQLWTQAVMNSSGLYCVTHLPGLDVFERADDDDAAWTAPTGLYRVEIRDPRDRFLPIAFDAHLPVSGPFDQLGLALSPPALFPIFASPPSLPFLGAPLFSSPSRPTPEPFATVRAQLREWSGQQRPAAWCLVVVSIGSKPCGVGLADREGRVAVHFPYPPPPTPSLVSPPSARNDFRWSVDVAVYYVARAPEEQAPDIADLAAVFAQLQSPQPLYGALGSPPRELAPQPLDYRAPLTLRTEIEAGRLSSYLYVGAA